VCPVLYGRRGTGHKENAGSFDKGEKAPERHLPVFKFVAPRSGKKALTGWPSPPPAGFVHPAPVFGRLGTTKLGGREQGGQQRSCRPSKTSWPPGWAGTISLLFLLFPTLHSNQFVCRVVFLLWVFERGGGAPVAQGKVEDEDCPCSGAPGLASNPSQTRVPVNEPAQGRRGSGQPG